MRLPNSESWIPICLPRFNSRGFLHAFISYFDSQADATAEETRSSQDTRLEESLGLGLILVTADKEGFFDMKSWKDHIVAQLLRRPTGLSSTISALPQESLFTRLLQAIVPAANNASATLQDQNHLPSIQPIKHFWYKSKTHVQIFTPFYTAERGKLVSSTSFSGVYAASATRRQALIAQYLHVREALHNSAGRTRGDGPSKLIYVVTQDEAVLGLVSFQDFRGKRTWADLAPEQQSTTSYELYVCLPSQTRKVIATEAAQALARWIRKHERRIFLTSSSSF